MKFGLGFWAALVCAGPMIVACNAISGADDISFTDDDDGGSTSGVTSTGTGQGGTSGSGGNTTNTSTSSAGGMGSGGQGSGGGPNPCVYPTGPYGVGQGQTVPPTLSWQGYLPGASSPTTITMESFFDCDGSHGIDAVIIDTSQYG